MYEHMHKDSFQCTDSANVIGKNTTQYNKRT